MAVDLTPSRHKLKDIDVAMRRGVHRPELVVACRIEIADLAVLRDTAPPAERPAIEAMIARYEAMVIRLID